LNALAPCLGAALVIYAGRGDLNLVGKTLGSAALVFIGRISYSLYLWHWSIIVFYKYIHITPISRLDQLIIVALSSAAAILSYFFIEKPFRQVPTAKMRPRVFAGGAAAIVLCMVIGLSSVGALGWPGRFPQSIVDIVDAKFATNPRTTECLGGTLGGFGQQQHPDFKCVIGADTPPRIALWGDSHGNALIPGFGEEAAARGQSLVFFGHRGCFPLVDVRRVDDPRLPCGRYAQEILQLIQDSPNISTVIIAARWPGPIYGPSIALGPAENGQRLAVIADVSQAPPRTVEEIERLFGDKLDQTIARLRAMGKAVVLVESIPEVGYDVPSTLARLTMLKRESDIIEPSFQSFLSRNRGITPRIEKSAAEYGLTVIRPMDALCDHLRCRVIVDGKPAYSDDDHLSIDGSRVVAKLFEPVFASMGHPQNHGKP
jgi:hypothetical protein